MTKMRQWSIVTAVAVIIVLAAGWFLLVKPQNSKASELHSQAATQQQENAVLQSQIAQLQSEEKSLPRQQAALRKFSTQVPDNAAEPTVIRQLSAAANGAGVDLLSLTPGTPAAVASSATTPSTTDTTAAATGSTSLTPSTTSGGLMQLPISIGITGTFPNVESFFQSLETLPRALMVGSWSLCPEGSTPSATSSSASSGTGASCTPPTVPSNKTPTSDELGGTLSATIFYAPPAGTVVPSTTGATTATTPAPAATPGSTTAPTTATTPVPSTSTAATPATTGATSPPAS
jgi:Tfp pilus assembly protein PilO